jgi:hypothetical protein
MLSGALFGQPRFFVVVVFLANNWYYVYANAFISGGDAGIPWGAFGVLGAGQPSEGKMEG